jgi:hypothetical protein
MNRFEFYHVHAQPEQTQNHMYIQNLWETAQKKNRDCSLPERQQLTFSMQCLTATTQAFCKQKGRGLANGTRPFDLQLEMVG